MDARQELEELRRLEALEKKMAAAAAQESVVPALKKAGSAVVSGGKSLARGFLGGLATAAEGAAAFNYADRMGRTPEPGQELTQAVKNLLPVPEEETTFERLARRGLEGAGASFAFPVPGAMAANTFAGGVGGVTGELGRSYGESLGPKGEVAGEILGGLVGGGAAGWLAGPKQSVAQQDLKRQMDTMTPADWAATQQNADKLIRSGAQTATAADAFPAGSGVRTLAQSTINREGGQELAARVGPRFEPGGDMQRLTDQFLDSLAPRIEPAQTANQLSDAADAYTKNLDRLASEGVTNRLAGKSLREVDVETIYNELMARANAAAVRQPDLAPVYREVASKLLQGVRGPKKVVTDLQGLSYQLKNLKDSPVSPDASAGRKGENAMWRKAIGDAEELLGQKSPDWKAAMKDFEAFKQGPASEARTGALRRIANKNPNLENPAPLGRLESFITGYDPQTIENNAKLLSNPYITQGATVDANEIARALAQRRVYGGSSDPGTAIRGQAGSDKEAALRALAPNMRTEPLEVADMLQGLKPKNFNQESIPETRWWQGAIRPFRTLDMMITLKNERGIAAEVARLVKDPRNIPELQKIAMFDPSVRKQLTLIAAMRPIATGASTGE